MSETTETKKAEPAPKKKASPPTWKVTNVSLDPLHALARRMAPKLQMEPIINGKRLAIRSSVLLDEETAQRLHDELERAADSGVVRVDNLVNGKWVLAMPASMKPKQVAKSPTKTPEKTPAPTAPAEEEVPADGPMPDSITEAEAAPEAPGSEEDVTRPETPEAKAPEAPKQGKKSIFRR